MKLEDRIKEIVKPLENLKIHLNGPLNLKLDVSQKIMETNIKIFDEAVKYGALYPYKPLTEICLKQLEELKNKILKHGSMYKESKESKESLKLSQAINSHIITIKDQIPMFQQMEEMINNHIELTIEPDSTGEIFYLNQALLILPTEIKSKGYHVFEGRGNINFFNRFQFLFQPLTEYGFETIEEAKKKYIDPTLFCTIATAKNTENYPLRETVLPIISKKYEKRIRENNL